MLLKGWIRPLRREAWRLAPDAGDVLRFMSTQANLMGASVVAALLAFDFAKGWIFAALLGWVVLAAIGAVIEQPELENGDV